MSRTISRKLAQSQPYVCPRCAIRPFTSSSPRRASSPSPNGKHDSVLGLLEERGFVNQIAGDRDVLNDILRTRKVGIYAGVDPTAPSLHLGNLLPIMILFWASIYGHQAVSLVGSFTARFGDPSGRTTSRVQKAKKQQMLNAVEMFNQTFALWKNAVRYARRYGYEDTQIEKFKLLENAKWLDKLTVSDYLEGLSDATKVTPMLGRDTFKNKVEKGDGVSAPEFNYPLLQGWDWWHMYSAMGVQIQVGGSDQYGNIITGLDVVRNVARSRQLAGDDIDWLDAEGRFKSGRAPIGLTVPLLTTASGEKFGKSAGNAIWLDSQLTSSFDLYGFLLRSSDADVKRYLKLFTFVPLDDIDAIMAEHNIDPGKRRAQHLLASEVLELVHGRDAALKARAEHEASRNPNLMFSSKQDQGADESATAQQLTDANRIYLPQSLVYNTPFARILYHAGLAPTKSEGARLIAKGGVYLATSTHEGDSQDFAWSQIRDQRAEDAIGLVADSLLLLRIGKWKVRVIEVVDDDRFAFKGLDAPGWDEWRKRRTDS